MKLTKLKIPTKDLPLIALGLTSVLVCGILKIGSIKYVIIGIFFGILSKDVRWTFWGFNVLIELFRCFVMILRTDSFTVTLDMLVRITTSMTEFVKPHNILSPSTIEKFLISFGNNPIVLNPVVINVISFVFSVLGIIILVGGTIFVIGYIIYMLPIMAHIILMLYLFHKNELMFMLQELESNNPFPDWFGRIVAPYLVQGIAIQLMLGITIFPLVIFRILRRFRFYNRFPVVRT